jgi:murein L,D-transpeptidase YafK
MIDYCMRRVFYGLRVATGIAACSLLCVIAQAQPPKDNEGSRPANIKVLKEYSDGKGNMIRVLQYSQGGMRVTEQIIIPKTYTRMDVRVPIDPDTMKKEHTLLVVDKSKYSLRLYYNKKLVRSYKAVFGPNPAFDKRMEGDRCTPEGWFKIANKHASSKYNKILMLDYPNDSSKMKFSQNKTTGKIPSGARIGGDVGIHGIWKGGDDMIELNVGWTDGCVALKNKDMDDLYTLIGVGTRVLIRK